MIPSLPHLLIFGLIALLLFGRGRISDLMEDVGKGIKGFKKGLTDEEPPVLKPVSQIDAQAAPAAHVAQPVTPPSETH